MKRKISDVQIKNYLETSLDDPEFETKYLEFIKFIEKIPLSFKSKEEKI